MASDNTGRSPGGWPGQQDRGIRRALLALVHALAFVGLLLAGTVLLVVTVAPAVIGGLGLGHLIRDALRGGTNDTTANYS